MRMVHALIAITLTSTLTIKILNSLTTETGLEIIHGLRNETNRWSINFGKEEKYWYNFDLKA